MSRAFIMGRVKVSEELEKRLRQPAVFAEPAESQRCHLVMAEAADQLKRYREALEMISGHIRDPRDPIADDYFGCKTIARQALEQDQ